MKVLVVEDEPRIAHYLKKGLEQAKYVVDVANTGDDGYDLATRETYDVMVIDRMLPGMSGTELCQQIRSQGIQTPLLFLTAKTAVAERVEGLEAGADDYLGKPFAFTEFLARVKALARRQPLTQPDQSIAGDLILDRLTTQVTRAGQAIQLSKTEFELLDYLIKHAGQVVSPAQLTEHVWSYDSDVLPNTAQVYIGYLRAKIDKPFPNLPQLIQTVRGFGYRLVAQVGSKTTI